MPDSKPLELVLLWHMHQPDFRDCGTGQYRLPWVYLHALKDYADMAAHLERHPGVRAVVNFVPVLLDQLEDYAAQFASGEVRDPLLAMLLRGNLDELDAGEREFILDRCFRANHTKMIEPYPAYRRLLELFRYAEGRGPSALAYLSGQYLADLVTWYHLAWTGETVRREHAAVAQLMSKGEQFSAADRRRLFELIGAVVTDIVPRWQRLSATGRVEISSTPHWHPIGPLLLDFKTARETQPALPLPRSDHYPGGRQRFTAHLDSAMESHTARFGTAPTGIWPAEGALSDGTLEMLAARGVRWCASGEALLNASLAARGPVPAAAEYLYRGYRFRDGPLHCFFRDDRLSDLIGFEYSKWHGRDACAHFIAELEKIAAAAPAGSPPLVSVILDGENAWEYFPYNGFYFLDEMYEALEAHPDIRTMTYRDVLAREADARFGALEHVVAGSWVYGNLSTWIGSGDKNIAWDLLCQVKHSFDLVMASGRLPEAERALAERQLAICEGSDWFWWFGDYNPPESVTSMDRVFRLNLAHLHRLLGLPVPAVLDQPISQGGGHAEMGGAMRRAS
jgi:alpha-amylase/alpha-mannosidase (GH57 family)